MNRGLRHLSEIQRIVITGSESTGKTTLARELAARLGADWIPEFARLYAANIARPLGSDDVEPIAHGQITLQDTALAPRHGLLVQDTDLVSTVVYARHYYGHCPEWVLSAAKERLGDLYLLLDTDVDWVPDDVRDLSNLRAEVQSLLRNQLRDFGARVVEIRGLGEARLANALHAVEEFRAHTC